MKLTSVTVLLELDRNELVNLQTELEELFAFLRREGTYAADGGRGPGHWFPTLAKLDSLVDTL
jgi:hypothetical protein